MALVLDSKQREKVIRLEMPCSLLYALKVVHSSINDLILTILREYYYTPPNSKMKSRGYGRDIISQLDKLYFEFYPYPTKRFTENIIRSKIRDFL